MFTEITNGLVTIPSWLIIVIAILSIVVFVGIVTVVWIFFKKVNAKRKYWKEYTNNNVIFNVHQDDKDDKSNKENKLEKEKQLLQESISNLTSNDYKVWSEATNYLFLINKEQELFLKMLAKIQLNQNTNFKLLNPEEKNRLRFIFILNYYYQIAFEQMVLEFDLQLGSNKLRSDIAIFEENNNNYDYTNTVCLIEIKKANVKQDVINSALKQLESYLNSAVNTQYGILYTGNDNYIVIKKIDDNNKISYQHQKVDSITSELFYVLKNLDSNQQQSMQEEL